MNPLESGGRGFRVPTGVFPKVQPIGGEFTLAQLVALSEYGCCGRPWRVGPPSGGVSGCALRGAVREVGLAERMGARDWTVQPEDRELLRSVLGRRVVTLASESPRRREILAQCGIRYRVARPRVEEPPPDGRDPRGWAREWALRKCLSIPRRQADDIVLGADTVVICRGRALGKPRDAVDAESMLRKLSGRAHRVVTGFAVVTQGGRKRHTGSAESMVWFRPLSPREITDYVESGEPMDKAGAYAIQGGASEFVTEIEGPYDNIVGLPVRRLAQVLGRVLHGRASQ